MALYEKALGAKVVNVSRMGDKVLNARTEYLGEDGTTQVVLNYPVKICNIAHGRERWQVDTGAVLLPDLSAKAELPIGVLRMGYIVFNSWDWAEVILRKPGKQGCDRRQCHARLKPLNRGQLCQKFFRLLLVVDQVANVLGVFTDELRQRLQLRLDG